MNNTAISSKFPKVIHITEDVNHYEEHDELLKIIDQGLMSSYDSPSPLKSEYNKMINIKAQMSPNSKSPLLGWTNQKMNDDQEDLSIDTVTNDMVVGKSRTPIKIKYTDYATGMDGDGRESFLRRRDTNGGLIPKFGDKSVVSMVKQAN